MSIIKLHDKYFKPYITREQIDQEINKLAEQISEDFKDENPLFIGVLNGAFMFVADFLRAYKFNCEISFVKLSSYNGMNSTGKIKQLVGLTEPIEGRTVIILEDIIDSGNTLEEIYNIFKDKKLKNLKIATLFFKPEVYKKELQIDYIGLPIPDKFIIGYGLDYDGLGRNIASVYQLTDKPNMKNIVLFGPPGAGKGTQANILKEKYGLIHISTGELFRENIRNKTEMGKWVQTYIDDGNLVPDEVTIEMLKSEVDKYPDAKGFIFDGFPRTRSQAVALDVFLDQKGETISGMVSIEVPDTILVHRIMERGKTSGRVDDENEQKILQRFSEYNTKTSVLKDYYQSQNKYYGIEGVGTIEEITDRLSTLFDNL